MKLLRLCSYKVARYALTGTLLFGCASHASRFDTVHVHTWQTKSQSGFFPEMDDPRVAVPELKQRASFGIAFSGGGTRSAAATLGELRALNMLGWPDHARYISANSGGSWAVWPYIYLPPESEIKEEVFLGNYVPPEQINDDILKPDNQDNDGMSLANAIYRSQIGTKLLSTLKGDEAYADVIGKIFLKRFGLHDRNKLFSLSKASLDSLLEYNPDLKPEDFYLVSRSRPYPIIVGSLRVPTPEDDQNSELYLLESTPLYTGVRNEFRVQTGKPGKVEQLLVGGGYVESFGYDSYEPVGVKDGIYEVRLTGKLSRGKLLQNKRYRFTLSDVIGMSGAAPSIFLKDKKVPFSLFPSFRHWAIDRKKVQSDQALRAKAKELIHGDGGDIDNLAVMPLLARRLDNILVFINTRTAFSEKANCSQVTDEIMVDDLISLFRPIGKNSNNVVFDDKNGERLTGLCQEFAKLKDAHEPLVVCDRYKILDNERMAVKGADYTPSICWVYLDAAKKWLDKLDASAGKKTADLKNGKGDFDNFPQYKTFVEARRLIDMDRERVHALANLTAWTVLEKKEYLAQHLSGANLETKVKSP